MLTISIILSLLVLGFFFAGCTCCPPACAVCQDDFTRANSTDISTGSNCGWTEVAGNWEILSNKLRIATANALATSNTAATDDEHRLTCTVNATSAVDARIIVDYQDASNYHFAEISFNATPALSVFRLIKRVAGVNTTLVTKTLTASPLKDYRFAACIDTANNLKGFFGVCRIESAITPFGAGTAGVGTGAAGAAVDFDDVVIDRTTTSAGCKDCTGTVCGICTDNFNRASTTDVNAGSTCEWEEAAGNWSIVSDSMLEITTANAILASTTSCTNEQIRLHARVRASVTGTLARLIIDYQDSNNYHFAEVKFGISGSLALYQRVAGVETQLKVRSQNVGLNYFWESQLCINSAGKLIFFLGGFGLLVDITPFGVSGFALGTGGTVSGTVNFDDVTAARLGADCGSCVACPARCEPDVPDTLTVVWTGFTGTGNCSTLNASWVCEWTMQADGECIWEYPALVTVNGNRLRIFLRLGERRLLNPATLDRGAAEIISFFGPHAIEAVTLTDIPSGNCAAPWPTFDPPQLYLGASFPCSITGATASVP